MNTKSKSETPRVDAAIKSIHEDHKLNHVDDFNHYFLMTGLLSDFARQLEKELNEANKQIVGYQSACEGWQERFVAENTAKNELKEERDILAKLLEGMINGQKQDQKYIEELAKENKRMREALVHCYPSKVWDMARQFYSSRAEVDGDACRNKLKENCKMVDAALEESNPSNLIVTNLIVLTRNELIAEIEKMPCHCYDRSGNSGTDTGIIKCHRCQWLARVKGSAVPS